MKKKLLLAFALVLAICLFAACDALVDNTEVVDIEINAAFMDAPYVAIGTDLTQDAFYREILRDGTYGKIGYLTELSIKNYDANKEGYQTITVIYDLKVEIQVTVLVVGTVITDTNEFIAAVENQQDGQYWGVKNGTYTVSNAILTKSVTIIGENREKTIFTTPVLASVFVLGNSLSRDNIAGLTIENITIKAYAGDVVYYPGLDYPANSDFGSVMIYGYGTAENPIAINNCSFVGDRSAQHCGNGIMTGYVNPEYFYVTGCSFTNLTYGAYFNQMSNLVVDSSTFYNIKHGGVVVVLGDYITITNNVMTEMSWGGADSEYVHGITFPFSVIEHYTVDENEVTYSASAFPTVAEKPFYLIET